MKLTLLSLLLAVAAVVGVGAAGLSEARTHRFLDELEQLTVRGDASGYCGRLHPDLEVSIRDHSARPPADFDGGREVFCDYVSHSLKGVDLLGLSMQVRREDYSVSRSWWHPWTVQVRYREDRVTTMSRLNASLHTQGEDQMTLVQTFDGIKLRRLTSRTWRAE